MMADNIEHVITYWVIFQHFKSPALGGFAVIAHWLPFLLFSVPVGALAERVDPRRLIQSGMLLFIVVSIVWGVLILTDSLQLWHAAALLVAHGIAGVLWTDSVTAALARHRRSRSFAKRSAPQCHRPLSRHVPGTRGR